MDVRCPETRLGRPDQIGGRTLASCARRARPGTRLERPQGRFTRQLQVSDALDSANIAATYENGVLRLTIPMSQAAKPRRIEV